MTQLQAQVAVLSAQLAALSGVGPNGTVASITTTSEKTDEGTRAVATAAIVLVSLGMGAAHMLFFYTCYLRPKNIDEGNRQAIMMTRQVPAGFGNQA